MSDYALARTSPAPLPERSWLDRSLYPFASRFHEQDGHRLHYVDEGRGRPILFVHGTPSWSFEWRHAIAALRAEHRCVAIDHLGFGLSDKPAGAPYRPADHAARLARFVRGLDLRDVVLVVHDFGGPIGLPLALEGDRVRAVVIVNTWMWAHDDRSVSRLSRFVAGPIGRFSYLRLNASPRWLLPATFADRKKLTPVMHRHYLGPFAERGSRTAPWVLGCELAGSDPYYRSLWEKRAALARLPATLVWGTRDRTFGPAHLARWREALPEATVVSIGAGHFPHEEAPDEVTEAIRRAAR